eukprot:1157306-Pelagomonas_calceolata.AAC.2
MQQGPNNQQDVLEGLVQPSTPCQEDRSSHQRCGVLTYLCRALQSLLKATTCSPSHACPPDTYCCYVWYAKWRDQAVTLACPTGSKTQGCLTCQILAITRPPRPMQNLQNRAEQKKKAQPGTAARRGDKHIHKAQPP